MPCLLRKDSDTGDTGDSAAQDFWAKNSAGTGRIENRVGKKRTPALVLVPAFARKYNCAGLIDGQFPRERCVPVPIPVEKS